MKPLFPGSFTLQLATAVALFGGAGLAFGLWEDTESKETGFRGTGMMTMGPADAVEIDVSETVYTEEPYVPDSESVKASEVYENVQILGNLTDDNFNRLMTAMTEWVAPEQGCAYCHGEEGDFASDDLYPKQVARMMLQMTQSLNENWPEHVRPTGVTCYTCHRGNPVPPHVWFDADVARAGRSAGATSTQNMANAATGYTALPTAAFESYLKDYEGEIKVITDASRSEPLGPSIKDAEQTYGLMMHISQSLGVNCTYCHNTRGFYDWDQSPEVRARALAGLQMVREINLDWTASLDGILPEERLGPTGDGPKANCLTCHAGQAKPLGGYSIIDHWPELAGQGEPDYSTVGAADAAAENAELRDGNVEGGGEADTGGGDGSGEAAQSEEQPAEAEEGSGNN